MKRRSDRQLAAILIQVIIRDGIENVALPDWQLAYKLRDYRDDRADVDRRRKKIELHAAAILRPILDRLERISRVHTNLDIPAHMLAELGKESHDDDDETESEDAAAAEAVDHASLQPGIFDAADEGADDEDDR